MADLPPAPTNEEVDEQARRVTDALRLAAEAVGSKHRCRKVWAWWDGECEEVRARAAGGQREDRLAYRALLSSKRKEYWARYVERADLPNGGVFQVTGWRKPRAARAPPAFGEDESLQYAADVLYAAYLDTNAVDVLASTPAPFVPPKVHPFLAEVTPEEAYWNTCDAYLQANAPGPDHASVSVLRTLWPGLLERLLPPPLYLLPVDRVVSLPLEGL